MNTYKINEVEHIVKNTNGKYFTVEFLKADNSLRTMNCRTKVKKHLKGGIATYDAKDKESGDKTIGVFDQKSGQYRCFKASRVQALVVSGNRIEFK